MLGSLSLDPHPRYIVLDAGKILEVKLMDQRTCSQNIISFNGFIDWIFQAVFKKPGFFYWKFLATLTWGGEGFQMQGAPELFCEGASVGHPGSAQGLSGPNPWSATRILCYWDQSNRFCLVPAMFGRPCPISPMQ